YPNLALSIEVKVDASDNIVVVGEFQDTVDFGGGPVSVPFPASATFVVKFDAAGNYLWSKTFAPQMTWGDLQMDLDPAGNIVIAGTFSGTIDFGGGPLVGLSNSPLFVARFNAAGGHVFSKTFNGFAEAGGVAFDPSGNIVLSGTFDYPTDFGGGFL